MRKLKLIPVFALLALVLSAIPDLTVAQEPPPQESAAEGVQPSGNHPCSGGQGVTPMKDPWLQKPVLPYLLLTEDQRLKEETQALYDALGLSKEEVEALQQVTVEEQRQMQALYRWSQSALQDETSTSVERGVAVDKHAVKP
ncbi:MAG TPA: hypothetical protein IGP91_04455 [Thermosynechococcus sp. M46_R2017_013]|nr:hypothetical protein [Thermosynechococcus sp. M46_R2017_013]